jgi:CelD/BcsL family acetyltransferase involved in cellulose biosynthesis
MTTELLAVDPRSDPRWWQLVSGPGGSLFTSPPWLTALSETYGFRPRGRLLVDSSGTPVAGFAWADVDDLRGARRIALPFSDRADPVVADAGTWRAVSTDAFGGNLPFRLRCLETSPAVGDPRFTTSGEAAWHETRLDRPLDELQAGLRPATRRNIATADRAGVKVDLSEDVEAVREYHRLHVLLRKRKYRLFGQPREFFEHLHQAFAPRGAIRTALAMVGGRPVAGAVYLVWGDTVYYKFGASLTEHLRLRPNDALHWALIQWARARGLRALDWGLSDLDQPGLCAYKRNWASTEGRIRTLQAAGTTPTLRRPFADEALRVLTALFTAPSVPDAITARAGGVLYRFFC